MKPSERTGDVQKSKGQEKLASRNGTQTEEDRQECLSYRRLILRNAAQDFGGVAFGFDEWPDGFDFAGFADEERAADDAHEFASQELLLLPGAEGFDGFVVRIAQQRKVEMVFGFEAGLGLDRIGAQAEDGHAVLVELALCVAKLGRLDGST